MYHVKERTSTVVSPRLSLAAPAGGLPTQAQTDALDEARLSATPRCACSAGVLPTPRRPGEPLDPGAARDSRGPVHCEAVGCQ